MEEEEGGRAGREAVAVELDLEDDSADEGPAPGQEEEEDIDWEVAEEEPQQVGGRAATAAPEGGRGGDVYTL